MALLRSADDRSIELLPTDIADQSADGPIRFLVMFGTG
jgi:hypothetical protein